MPHSPNSRKVSAEIAAPSLVPSMKRPQDRSILNRLLMLDQTFRSEVNLPSNSWIWPLKSSGSQSAANSLHIPVFAIRSQLVLLPRITSLLVWLFDGWHPRSLVISSGTTIITNDSQGGHRAAEMSH